MSVSSPGLDTLLARMSPEAVLAAAVRLLASSPRTRSVAVTSLIADFCAGADLGTGADAAAAHLALHEAVKQAALQTPDLRYVSASA